jgi:PleD family two-component response regulator
MPVQNILMVDDKPENLVALEAILEGEDRNLVKATSGNEALGLLLKHDFALVLLDVQMPDMDGFEVAELMRMNRRIERIPIIFISAISKEDRYVFKGYEAGAVDYLFKPIEPIVLRSKVSFFLEMDQQKRRLEQLLERSQASADAFREAMEKSGVEVPPAPEAPADGSARK